MTKTIRRITRLAVTPAVLVTLWLFVRFLSVFVIGILQVPHHEYEEHLARTMLWWPIGAAGAAGLAWWISDVLRWQIIRTIANECFSVFIAVFIGLVMTLVHAKYEWPWYFGVAGCVLALVILGGEDERAWSRAIRFSLIPVATLLTFHYSMLP